MKFVPHEIFTHLDLEMNQPSGKIIQVGYSIGNIFTGEELIRNSIIVNPHEILNPFIIQLTGITQEQVDNGTTLKDAYERLAGHHLKYGAFVNPVTWGGSDLSELRDQLGMKADGVFGRRHVDVKTIYQAEQYRKRLPVQAGLAKAMSKCGLQFLGRKHQAADDAFNTFVIHRFLLGLLYETDKTKS